VRAVAVATAPVEASRVQRVPFAACRP